MVFTDMSNGQVNYRSRTEQIFFFFSLLHQLTDIARKSNISSQAFFAFNKSQTFKNDSFGSPEVVLTFAMENGEYLNNFYILYSSTSLVLTKQ